MLNSSQHFAKMIETKVDPALLNRVIRLLIRRTSKTAMKWFKIFLNPDYFYYVGAYRGITYVVIKDGDDIGSLSNLNISIQDIFGKKGRSHFYRVSDGIMQELRKAIEAQKPEASNHLVVSPPDEPNVLEKALKRLSR